MNNKLWLEDPKILINNPLDFFPSSLNTDIENINSLIRLSFYISSILYFYHKKSEYFYIFIITIILTYMYYTSFIEEDENFHPIEHFQQEIKQDTKQEDCVEPTLSNPFMNVLYTDYIDNPNRPPACDQSNFEINEKIDNYFYNNLFRNTNDLYGKMNSERQFYTTPITTIPNDQESFMNWCYKTGPICKEDTSKCYKYEDLRGNRPIIPYPNLTDLPK